MRKKEKYVETQVENIVVHLQKQKEVREPRKENRRQSTLCHRRHMALLAARSPDGFPLVN